MGLTQQPISQVTPDDVDRIVRRDYSADEYAAVRAILDNYGTEKPDRLRIRVQLATLKIANTSLDGLRAAIEFANGDYRDALSAAEYPAYSKFGWNRNRKLTDEEKERIYESDWQQYEEWLKRD